MMDCSTYILSVVSAPARALGLETAVLEIRWPPPFSCNSSPSDVNSPKAFATQFSMVSVVGTHRASPTDRQR